MAISGTSRNGIGVGATEQDQELRAEAYAALAAALAPPESEADLREALAAVTASLASLGLALPEELRPGAGADAAGATDSQPERAVAARWRTAFGRPGGLLRPVESCYRPWTTREAQKGAAALTGAEGYLLSDAALHVQALYAAAGAEVPPEWKAEPDALHLELQFMSLLARAGTETDRLQFLQDHLDWIPLLAADGRNVGLPWPYQGLLQAAAAVVTADLARSGNGGAGRAQKPPLAP